ncbi:MAG: DUF3224 domain-containing protein [Streptosporangiaceae bacterium]
MRRSSTSPGPSRAPSRRPSPRSNGSRHDPKTASVPLRTKGRIHVEESFSGDIEGDGITEFLQAAQADGSASFVGIERVAGTVADRRGTFLLHDRVHADLGQLDRSGLQHFEGRSFPGWHHYMTLVSMAHAWSHLYDLPAQN